MAKVYYPPECPFCEAPQVDGAGDVDGRWAGPGQNVRYSCGALSHFKYAEGAKNIIYIKVTGCAKAS